MNILKHYYFSFFLRIIFVFFFHFFPFICSWHVSAQQAKIYSSCCCCDWVDEWIACLHCRLAILVYTAEKKRPLLLMAMLLLCWSREWKGRERVYIYMGGIYIERVYTSLSWKAFGIEFFGLFLFLSSHCFLGEDRVERQPDRQIDRQPDQLFHNCYSLKIWRSANE